jgi:hypothetical protein
MSAAMPPNRRAPPTKPAAFVPGTRATAPAALEESSESAWQMFQELQRVHGQPVSAGGPAQPPARGFEHTQPMHGRVPAPQATARPASMPPVSLDVVMQLARRNNRACPVPEAWAAFHKLLPARRAGSRTIPAPPPVDGPAWAATSAMQKRLRLRDQIEWAEREKALPAVFEFLSGLREEEWHHFG